MIMNRDKVLELAQMAGFNWPEISTTTIEERLERFAALIEAEVRGGMSRDKVFELMLTAGCSKYCDPKHPELEGFIVNDSVLDRIVALIEREVRGDAEPVGYTNEGYKGMQYANAEAYKEIHPNFIQRNKLTAPLFMHPAPAVDAKPVAWTTLEELQDLQNYTHSSMWGEKVWPDEVDYIPLYTHPAPSVVRQLVEALEELARLGNGDRYGNSLGNEIAQKALKKWMECQ